MGIFLAWFGKLEASEVKKENTVEMTDRYPNFLLYNSTTSCFRGIVNLMLMLNPQLAQSPMPPAIQQQMLAHCSCIMDRIREKYTIHEYNSKLHDYLWIRQVWGKLGTECTKAGYLAGLGIEPGDTISEDNKTKESPEQDSEEEPLTEDATQFQG